MRIVYGLYSSKPNSCFILRRVIKHDIYLQKSNYLHKYMYQYWQYILSNFIKGASSKFSSKFSKLQYKYHTVCTLPDLFHVLFSLSKTFIYKKKIYLDTYIYSGNTSLQLLHSGPLQYFHSQLINTMDNFLAHLLTFNVLLLFNF